MNNNNSSISPTKALYVHSIMDWLVLSGISMEVAEVSTFQQSVNQTEEVLEALPNSTAMESTKPNTAKQSVAQPVLQNHYTIPVFQSLDELNEFAKSFKEFGLSKTASSCVLGRGSLNPDLLVIGDMPEDQEDRSGIAFSASINEMLHKALHFAGIPADTVYFTYLTKWRPPGKRALNPSELDVCSNLLHQEIKLLRPKAILALTESSLKAVSPDSWASGAKMPFIKNDNNHVLGYELPLLASQKCEFLVKNSLMKKNFWLSLLNLALTIRA